jgi:hypothetical protein
MCYNRSALNYLAKPFAQPDFALEQNANRNGAVFLAQILSDPTTCGVLKQTAATLARRGRPSYRQI